ncbi:hypothetical protein AABB24_020352 [Solanum stoloniferum]|uniref:Uncharacterized protein n=1 Tax=Solanum stoloniferum TaxID=62892 RepID=A0ABD2T923_9SOLN
MKEENYGRVIFAASSNLKRKHHNYIRGSIEKERGQGLKKSTIFTSQGMQTIYKNFAVEKCTQEVEAIFFRCFGISLDKDLALHFLPNFCSSFTEHTSFEDTLSH